jgi:hypothetical protein
MLASLAFMKQIILDFLLDTLEQIFGVKTPKSGKLGITYWGMKRMNEYQLTLKDLEDVFRYGEEVKPEMIIRKYQNYQIGLTTSITWVMTDT